MGCVVRLALTQALERFTRADREVSRGRDPEAVHQLRVGLRRFQATMRTWERQLDDGAIAPLGEELSWLLRLAGRARDADVRDERLRTALAAMAAPDGEGVILDRSQLDVDAARQVLGEAMEEPRYAALVAALTAFAAEPSFRSGAVSAPAAEVAPGVTGRAARRLVRCADRLGPEPTDAALHQVRLHAKRLRYAAEGVAAVLGTPARRLATGAARVQEVLGAHQDAVVLRRWLAGVAADEPAAAFLAGELAGLELARAADARETWPRAWDRLERRGVRRWAGC